MKKYKTKKPVKSVGFFSRIFNLFSDLYGGEKIANSFKSIAMSFQGKSKKQIEEHFKIEEYKKDLQLKQEAERMLER